MTRKTNSSIGTAKDEPRLRLKALRKEVQLTQEKLAARCGMSYPYILAVETGRLPLTSSLAEAVSCATGISPAWLLGKEGGLSRPVTPLGAPYTREYFVHNFQQRHGLLSEIDPDGDESTEIHARCHELTQLMRTAWRKRRFPLALYFFRKMSDEITRRLRLGRAQKNEQVERLEKHLFGPLGGKSNTLRDDFDVDILWRLMSPTGCIKWADAYHGDQQKQDEFLRDLDGLKELVEQSFEREE